MWFVEREVPKYRSARMMWICDPVNSEDPEAGCPSNCLATNLLPYSTIEFDPKNFPEDTWVFYPCEKHADTFRSYPDVVARS